MFAIMPSDYDETNGYIKTKELTSCWLVPQSNDFNFSFFLYKRSLRHLQGHLTLHLFVPI